MTSAVDGDAASMRSGTSYTTAVNDQAAVVAASRTTKQPACVEPGDSASTTLLLKKTVQQSLCALCSTTQQLLHHERVGRVEHDAEPITIYDREHYGREPHKMAIAFLFTCFSAFLNFFLLVIVHDVVPKHEALPDLVFMLIPQQRWAWVAGDVLGFLSTMTTFALLVLHRHRWIVFRRAFLIYGIMYGLRALCLGTTFLPPSFHHRQETCYPQANWTVVGVIDVSR